MRALRAWPNAVYVKQEGAGSNQTNVYDAETHEQLTRVMRIRITIDRGYSIAEVTMQRYADDLPAIADEPAELRSFEDLTDTHPITEIAGMTCSTHTYAIASLEATSYIFEPLKSAVGRVPSGGLYVLGEHIPGQESITLPDGEHLQGGDK